MQEKVHRVYVVGIAGGTGSGKTTLANAFVARMGPDRVTVLAHDAYYRDLAHLPVAERARVNFDHPDALETPLLIQHLDVLRSGQAIGMPVYDFSTHTRRLDTAIQVPSRPVILVEGILVLADADLRACLDLKVFVDADADLRLIRRLRRDTQERGRGPASVMDQYRATVRPMHDRFVAPSTQHADVIVPGTGSYAVAVGLLAAHVETVLSGT